MRIIRMQDGYLLSCTWPWKKEKNKKSSHYSKKLSKHLNLLVWMFLIDDKKTYFIPTSFLHSFPPAPLLLLVSSMYLMLLLQGK
jgi:hypothetical protein